MRKRQLIVGVMLLVFGTVPLLNTLSNPRLAALRAVDMVRLMASGACFGVAVVALLGRLRMPDQ